MNEHELTMKM